MFNVIWCNVNTNKMEAYDITPTLINAYKSKKKKNRPTTFEEFKEFIISESRYHWWAKCQYEIILSDWPCMKYQYKWDIHMQVMMNIDLITRIIMEEVKK